MSSQTMKLPEAFVACIDKPAGMSSFDVIRELRRTLRVKKMGHAGTLDPAATGVLVVCGGWATRIVPYLMATEKAYSATMVLGVTTSTDDAEGEVLERRPVPALAPGELEQVLARFTGPITQVPPAVSAIKIDGERAYAKARRGEEVTLQARPVEVHALRLAEVAPPLVRFEAVVSKGTYIRSLARDIGEALGCGAHLSTLRRTRSGSVDVEACATLQQLRELLDRGAALPLMTPWQALGHLPEERLDSEGRRRLVQGQVVELRGFAALPDETIVRVPDEAGELLAVARIEPGETVRRLRVERVRPQA